MTYIRPIDWPTEGWYFFLHHGEPVEYTWDIDERWAFVLCHKFPYEVPIRMAAMRPVRGQLPEAVLQAWAAFKQARAVYDQARAAYDQAYAAHKQAGAVYNKAWAAYKQAEAAYHQALSDHMPEIMALHALECPDVRVKDGQLDFGGAI